MEKSKKYIRWKDVARKELGENFSNEEWERLKQIASKTGVYGLHYTEEIYRYMTGKKNIISDYERLHKSPSEIVRESILKRFGYANNPLEASGFFNTYGLSAIGIDEFGKMPKSVQQRLLDSFGVKDFADIEGTMNINDIFQAYKDGIISYNVLKNLITNFKKSNEDYLRIGSK